MSMNFQNIIQTNVTRGRETHPFLARLFFHNRKWWILAFFVVTVFLGYHASKVRPQASFEKMVPQKHPYIQNFLTHRDDVMGGNIVRIAVADPGGNIFNDKYVCSRSCYKSCDFS